MDIVISDDATGHTLVDIIVADPASCESVERAARQDLVAATDAELKNEIRYRDRSSGMKFVYSTIIHLGLWHLSDNNRSCAYMVIYWGKLVNVPTR